MKRINLLVLRMKHHLTQEEMADKIGCSRITYSLVECGRRDGKKSFWDNLQKVFNIADEDMWKLQKKE